MPVRPLKDKDKYYPGSPFGDKPPEEMMALAGPGTVTAIQGLSGPIVEREVQAGHAMYLPQDAMKHVDAYFDSGLNCGLSSLSGPSLSTFPISRKDY